LRSWFCEYQIGYGAFVAAEISHYHSGDKLSRSYVRPLHTACFNELNNTEQRPGSKTRYAIRWWDKEVLVRGIPPTGFVTAVSSP
jgi:hypothetical protein